MGIPDTDQRLIDRVREDLTPVDLDKAFGELIDEIYSFDKVGGPFEHMQPSRVLQEMSPTDWRCGVADLSADERYVEIDGDTFDADDVQEIRQALEDEDDAALEEARNLLENGIDPDA